MTNVLQFSNISKKFNNHDNKGLKILDDVSFSLQKGEIAALIGPSGSGKSTILHIAGLLEKPSSGELFINKQQSSLLNDNERSKLRGRYLGFIYQFHHLLPEFTAIENISMPLIIQGFSRTNMIKKAEYLLERVGLSHRAKHKPSELSGGEKQRVAIARALINSPQLLLADEPTGNLDPATAKNIFSLFMEIAQEQNLTAIIATHNYDLANQLPKKFIVDNKKITIE